MKMRTRHRTFALLLAVISVFLGASATLDAQKPPKITGTYSNMSYNKEGGDVLGYELKIVFTGSSYQGALQIAEGVPGELMLVGIQSDGVKISFSIPAPNSYAGRFIGVIDDGVLKGEFRFKSGGSDKVELRKGKSYWD